MTPPDDKTPLSHQEIEQIKDDASFRAIVVQDLKYLKEKAQEVSTIRLDVSTLKTHRNIQWWFLTIIVVGILGVAFAQLKIVLSQKVSNEKTRDGAVFNFPLRMFDDLTPYSPSGSQRQQS